MKKIGDFILGPYFYPSVFVVAVLTYFVTGWLAS
jgi:hypothetical protein